MKNKKNVYRVCSLFLAITLFLTGCDKPLFTGKRTDSNGDIETPADDSPEDADTVDNSEDSAKTVQEEEEWDGRPIKVESPIMKIESHNPYSSGKEIVEFGKYEQDGNEANGAEPIKWIVLDENDSELLLFSEYGIENQCFNDEYEADKIWEDSDIRAFLNEEFMGKAFSEEEKGMIKLSVLENSANPSSGKGSGSSTNDYVFCLSLDELEKYYPSEDTGEPWIYKNSSVSCEVTEYASRFASYDTVSYENYIGEYIYEGVPDCIIGVRYADFWLRTSEALGHTGISVSRTGVFFYDEEDAYINTTVVVRPALRINKKALSSLNRYSYPKYSSVLTEEDMEKLTKSGFDINDYSEGEKLYLKTLFEYTQFDDGEANCRINKELYEYSSKCNSCLNFYDINGEELFSIYPSQSDIETIFRNSSDNDDYCARTNQLRNEETKTDVFFYFDRDENHVDNKYIPKEEWAKVAYYQNGNGIKYPFFDSMYSYYNHYEYRKNLIPEEMKELLFKTEDDEKWLMPTSDDFKIEWVDIPEVVKLKGYTSGYDELGFAIYGGIIGGSDSETMPCRFVKVTSYNARKEEISVKERLSFSCQEDCFYNVSTGDHLLYFLDYTGKNEIPDDYSPEELITYINDVMQLESIRNDPDSKVERIDCSYYYSHEYDGYSGLQAYDLESIFVLDIDSKVLSYRSESEGVVPFDTQYGYLVYDDYGYSGIKSGMCEGKSFYSDPQKHICKYYIGDGSEFTSVPEEMYNNGFIGYEKDNDYLSPASSDYIYCWDRDPWSYGNDFVTLISFDDKGNLIQFVKRGYKPENMVNSVSELIEGDSLEGSTTLYFDDSYYYIDILNYPYYKEQNKMSILFLMFNGEDFGRLNVLSEAASDNYRTYINKPGFSSSNSAVENTVILEDNLFDGLTMLSDNYLCLYHPDVEISGTKDGKKYNDSFIVDEYVFLFFDEKGYQIEGHNRFVDVFSSEKEAKEYYDEISTYLPGWEPEISGNAVATNGEAGTETKYYYLMHTDDEDFEYEFYFSKPYLTDSENAHLMRNTYNY